MCYQRGKKSNHSIAGFTQPFLKLKGQERDGFTLIELIIVMLVMGAIAAIAIPKVGNLIENTQIEGTQREMRHLVRGILGEHDEDFYGFKDTIGDLPDTLDDLFEQGTYAAYNAFTQIGWNGPYVETRQDGAGYDLKYDVWGNVYQYNKGAATITSYGPDGVSGGGDDIVVNIE